MIRFCPFGEGRIGAIHAGKHRQPYDARLPIRVDPDARGRSGRRPLRARSAARVERSPTQLNGS